MAKKFVSIDPYKIQFDTDMYDVRQENDNTVTAIAKGLPSHKAIISIRKKDPISPLSTDADDILRDTKIMAIRTTPNLPSLSMSARPSRVVIDGHDGFYVWIDFFEGNPKKVASAERVFCLLGDGYVLNILSTYQVDDNTGRSELVADLINTVHIKKSA